MSIFLDGLGKVFGKIADQFQGRTERLKNEKQRLLNERKEILDRTVTTGAIDRLRNIDNRVSDINYILANAAKD